MGDNVLYADDKRLFLCGGRTAATDGVSAAIEWAREVQAL
jgi:hypothetical protein